MSNMLCALTIFSYFPNINTSVVFITAYSASKTLVASSVESTRLRAGTFAEDRKSSIGTKTVTRLQWLKSK